MAAVRRSDALSRADHRARTDNFYGPMWRPPQPTPCDIMLILELPRTHWGVVAAMGHPHCDVTATRAVSAMLLLKNISDTAGQPSFVETLVDQDMLERSEQEKSDMSRATIRQHSVRGYRFYFPHSNMSAATASMLLSTRFNRLPNATAGAVAAAAAGSGGSGKRSNFQPVELPGRFDVDTERFDTEVDFRAAIAQTRGSQSQDMLPSTTSATYEIPAHAEIERPFRPADNDEECDALFGELPREEGEEDGAEEFDDEHVDVLPKTHVLYATELGVQSRSTFNQHRWNAWNLSPAQRSPSATWVDERKLVFSSWAIDHQLVQQMVGDTNSLMTRCLPEFVMNSRQLAAEMKRSALMAGNDISDELDSMSPEEIRQLSTPGTGIFKDPAEMAQVPVESDFSATDNQYSALLARCFPDMAQTLNRNNALLPHYIKRGEHVRFLTTCILPSIDQLFRQRDGYGAPSIYRRVHEDSCKRRRILEEDEHSPEARYAREAIGACNPDMQLERRRLRFGSWFMGWFGDMALNWFQLTRVQAAIAEFAWGGMARAGDLRSQRSLMSIGLIGAPEIGKSIVLQALIDMLSAEILAKQSQSGSALSDLEHTPGEISVQDERDHPLHNNKHKLTSHSTGGVRKHSRLRRDKEGNWAVEHEEFFSGAHSFFACNDMPGEAWQSRTVFIYPTTDSYDKGVTTQLLSSGCRRTSQRKAGQIVLKELCSAWYELAAVGNIGGCEQNDLIVNVLFRVASAVLGPAFRRMPNRHIDTIRNTATSYCMQRVTALWHLHVKTPKSRPVDMLRFYAHRLVVHPEDAWRAFVRVYNYTDRRDIDLGMAAALRASVVFEHGKPVTSSSGRYFQTELLAGAEARMVLSRLRSKDYGVGLVEDTLRRYQQERINNETILIPGSGKGGRWYVLKEFVLQPGIETPFNDVIWAALGELFEDEGCWSLDYETEEQVVFNKAARQRLLGHGTVANGIRALAGQPAAPVLQELYLMALAEDVQYYADHTSIQGEPHSVWVAAPHDPSRYAGAPVPGEPVLAGGGIETLRVQEGLRKTKSLQTEVLSVSLSLLLDKRTRQADGKARGAALDRLFASFIHISGGFLPGETFVQGLNSKSRHMYDTYVVESVPPDFKITIDNPQSDMRSRGSFTIKPGHKVGRGVTVVDKVFPAKYKKFVVHGGANLYNLIQDAHSRQHTGEPLPREWQPEVCEFAHRQVVAVRPTGETVEVVVSRGADSLSDSILTACGVAEDALANWSLRAEFGGREMVLGDECIDFWIDGPDDDLVTIVYEGLDPSPAQSPVKAARPSKDKQTKSRLGPDGSAAKKRPADEPAEQATPSSQRARLD